MKVVATKNGLSVIPETQFEKEFIVKRYIGNTRRTVILNPGNGSLTVLGETTPRVMVH